MSVAPLVPADVLGDEPQDWPLTIGVALPIPEPFLGELGAYRERFGDPLAHAIVAHITLVPPTEVADEEHLAEILAHLQAQAAQMEPFPIVLEGAGTFRPVSQVVFVPDRRGRGPGPRRGGGGPAGPAGPAPGLPVPPACDGRPRPRGGVARPGPRGSAEPTGPPSRSTASACSSAARMPSGARSPTSRSGSRSSTRRATRATRSRSGCSTRRSSRRCAPGSGRSWPTPWPPGLGSTSCSRSARPTARRGGAPRRATSPRAGGSCSWRATRARSWARSR